VEGEAREEEVEGEAGEEGGEEEEGGGGGGKTYQHGLPERAHVLHQKLRDPIPRVFVYHAHDHIKSFLFKIVHGNFGGGHNSHSGEI
jgi:hypothetical protein